MKNSKELVKQLKENLKGLTLQVVTEASSTPYYTLREFGAALIREELNGNTISITQAWTKSGIVEINSKMQLVSLLLKKEVTAIQFLSHRPNKTMLELLGTNE